MLFLFFSMFFGFFATIVLLSTMYDLLVQQYLKDNTEINIWTSFSIYSNCKQLMKTSKGDSSLGCIDGIKTLCMLAVVFGHKFAMTVIFGNLNHIDLFEWRTRYVNAWILSIHYSVDTFLVLSGMLLTYLYLKSKETIYKNKGFPLLRFYFYRFLRLWPGLIALILFYIGVLKYTGDGPFWAAAMYKAAPMCKATGWATALFMSNMVSFPFQCIEQAWYLAVDTQLYLISPVVLISMCKHPKTTTFICTLLCILSAIYVFVITHKYHYGHNVFEGDRDYHDYVYQPTYIRMPAWFIGVFLGYLLYYYKHVNIPKGLNVFIWILTATTMKCLVMVHTVLANNGYNNFYAALYNALARPLWALASGAVVFLCSTGHGGVVNQFLSHKVFKTVSKLSYGVYLVHLGFQAYITSSKRTFTYHNTFYVIHQFMADIVFIFVIAVLWSLTFEAPFINIAKLLLKKESLKRQQEDLKQQKKQKLKKGKSTNIKVYKSIETKKIE